MLKAKQLDEWDRNTRLVHCMIAVNSNGKSATPSFEELHPIRKHERTEHDITVLKKLLN